MELLLSLAAGLITGFVFTLIKLPIPAPPVWSGIFGIVGVLSGSQLCHYFIK